MHEFVYNLSARPRVRGVIKLATFARRSHESQGRSLAGNHESTPTDGNPRSYCRTRRHEPGAAARAADEPWYRDDAGDPVPRYPGPGPRQVRRRWSLSAEPGAARRARLGECGQTSGRRVPPHLRAGRAAPGPQDESRSGAGACHRAGSVRPAGRRGDDSGRRHHPRDLPIRGARRGVCRSADRLETRTAAGGAGALGRCRAGLSTRRRGV